jgi:hypothetical protein
MTSDDAGCRLPSVMRDLKIRRPEAIDLDRHVIGNRSSKIFSALYENLGILGFECRPSFFYMQTGRRSYTTVRSKVQLLLNLISISNSLHNVLIQIFILITHSVLIGIGILIRLVLIPDLVKNNCHPQAHSQRYVLSYKCNLQCLIKIYH